MNFYQLTMPRSYAFSLQQWQQLQHWVPQLLACSSATYSIESDDNSLYVEEVGQRCSFVLPSTNMGFDLTYHAPPGPLSADLSQLCLLVNHVSKGKITISSTTHRQQQPWQEAAEHLKTTLTLPFGTFTLPRIKRHLPTGSS